MPTSEKQIEANRRNAQKSTGPKTQAGKRASRHNALKHGILVREALISHGDYQEQADEFETLILELYADRSPHGPLEELLVQQIAVCYWRLRRVLRADAREFGFVLEKLTQPPVTSSYFDRDFVIRVPSLPSAEALKPILGYEQNLQTQLRRALAHLDALQAQRKRQAAPAPSYKGAEM